MRAAALLLVALLIAGCGQPSTPAAQEGALEAVAAEGALLAQDVADGATTGRFTRVHAEALRKEAEALTLAAGAKEVADELGRLASAPTDRDVAREVAGALQEAAE